MNLSRYIENLDYLPKKEQDAIQDLRIEEKEVENVPMWIIRRINALQGNGIKGLGGQA